MAVGKCATEESCCVFVNSQRSCTRSPASSMLSVAKVTFVPVTSMKRGRLSRRERKDTTTWSLALLSKLMLNDELSQSTTLPALSANWNDTLLCGLLTSESFLRGTYMENLGILKFCSKRLKRSLFLSPTSTFRYRSDCASLGGQMGTLRSDSCCLGHVKRDSPSKSWSAWMMTPLTTVVLLVLTARLTHLFSSSTSHWQLMAVSMGSIISCPSPCFICPVLMCRTLSS
mmetsp:Transcript_16107/g.40589  ORF Transcript_16107/g.40589 Transcript_16107/m.40589 type:complete len:229 (-) Transcript_16107:1131-1817(-)